VYPGLDVKPNSQANGSPWLRRRRVWVGLLYEMKLLFSSDLSFALSLHAVNLRPTGS